ncbi:hypothetical protein ACV2F4_07905 [Salmonella enterica subsp. houtenae serovar 6,7:z4,z24:-]
MQKIWALAILSLITLSGCSVAKDESGKDEAIALGEGCAVNVQADSYQVACTNADPAKIVNAIKTINQKLQGNSK